MGQIIKLIIDESTLLQSEQFRRERERVVTDFLRKNQVVLVAYEGPFTAVAAIAEHKFRLELEDIRGKQMILVIPLMSLRRVIKDYHIVCESYVQALPYADPSKIEAIDIGRRSLHNEGAEELQALLPAEIHLDFETARKLFTLIYVLQMR